MLLAQSKLGRNTVMRTIWIAGREAAVRLSARADRFGHRDGLVAFDTFRLDLGPLTCPSWWQDFAPDAG